MHVSLCTLYKIKLIRQRKSKEMFFLKICFRLFKSKELLQKNRMWMD